MEIAKFFLSVFIISFSGAMAPGPVTAATISQGTKNRFAGALIAAGHGIIEFPLIFLIILGFGKIVKSEAIRVSIGLLGGAFLIWMGFQLVRQIGKTSDQSTKIFTSGPVLTGMALSASNPYFLIWWVTVGLKYAIDAQNMGLAALIAFTCVHWSTDLIWFAALGYASFRGAKLLTPKKQTYILALCGVVMLAFGAKFIWDAAAMIL